MELYSVVCGGLNEKEIQKRGIYVCMWLIYFDIQQKLTQNRKAAILQFGCFDFFFNVFGYQVFN